jgi:DNA-binding transcriptional LysR family regulator
MDKFLEMNAFAKVVDAGSFTGAIEVLGISKAAVSRYVADLEARLGVRLLNRTTRRLSLTPEGEVFHARCQQVLEDVEQAESEITSRRGEATGALRITVPVSFGIAHLARVWGEFKARHPKVTLDVSLSDRVADLVEEGYDLAIRIADLPGSSLIHRPLSSTRVVMCASPAYLERAGRPQHPAELARHSVLGYSLRSDRDTWVLDGPDGEVRVQTQPCIRSNNGDVCRAGALQHQGIVLQPTFLVGEDLAAGRLVELMPQYQAGVLGIHAVYASRKHIAPKVRHMIDFLVEWFASERWPEVQAVKAEA